MDNNIETSNKKRGLGRGLGSLLGDQSAAQGASPQATPASAPPQPAAPAPPRSPVTAHANAQVTTPSTTPKTLSTSAPVTASQQPSQAVQVDYPKAAPTASAPVHVPDHARIWNIPIEKIMAGSHQPRKNFDKTLLEELAQSIREHGVLQPLLVRKKSDGRYELIAGERRWRASQLAGLIDVPAIVKNFEDRQSAEVALIENIQREDLNPVEEAMAMSKLIQDFGLTQQEVAARVGKERATITNSLRLLALPHSVLDLVSERKISQGHAKVLLSLDNSLTQIELAKLTVEKTLSVRQLESQVKRSKSDEPQLEEKRVDGTSAAVASQLVDSLSDDLRKSLGTKVQIDYSAGKGKISIYFYSDEELSNLIDKIK